MLPASRLPPPSRRASNWSSKQGAHQGTPSSANHTAAASQPTGRIAKAASWLHLSRVSPTLHPPERPFHTHTPKPGFGGIGHEMMDIIMSVAIVDSHLQRIVLATEETTVTQRVSHKSIKCQSRSRLQRGTTVSVSQHGDNPLLKSTGIHIATKSLPGPITQEHRKLIGVSAIGWLGGSDKLCDAQQGKTPDSCLISPIKSRFSIRNVTPINYQFGCCCCCQQKNRKSHAPTCTRTQPHTTLHYTCKEFHQPKAAFLKGGVMQTKVLYQGSWRSMP